MTHTVVEVFYSVIPARLPDLNTYCTCRVAGGCCPTVHSPLRAARPGWGDGGTPPKPGLSQIASCQRDRQPGMGQGVTAWPPGSAVSQATRSPASPGCGLATVSPGHRSTFRGRARSTTLTVR